MFRIFEEERLISGGMMFFLLSGIAIRILLGFLYQGMIKETDNMSSTNNKLLKQCKLKFSNCHQLNNGVANVPIFVDKFMNKMELGPISFNSLYHLSGQAMLLSVVCAGIGICKSIMSGKMLGEILPFYIVSFFGLYAYFSISTAIDIPGKRRILKVNLVDYLENHLSARMEVTEKDIDMLYGNSNVRKMHRMDESYGKRTVELMPMGERRGFAEVNPEELEDLLKEFLS